MAPSSRDRISVDLHGLKTALFDRAQSLSVSPSGLVRTTLAEALGQAEWMNIDRFTQRHLSGNGNRLRLCLRMSREQAGATMEAARRAGMNPGDYVGNLVANVPVLSAGGSRAEHIATLIASSAELSTLSRNIHRLTALLRHANVEPARQYREMLDTLAGEVREHLVVASCVLASLRPRREIAKASEQGDRERPASRPLSRRPPAHTRQVLTDEPE